MAFRLWMLRTVLRNVGRATGLPFVFVVAPTGSRTVVFSNVSAERAQYGLAMGIVAIRGGPPDSGVVDVGVQA
jgi:hypothetical protein